jgi:cullin 3
VKSANLLEVVDLGRDLFVKHIIRPPIKAHVINTILSLLHIERDGYVINRSAITSCVDTLSKLSDSSDGMTVYKQYLEPEILSQSEAYYKAEAGRLLETCDTLEYLRRVNILSLIVTAFLTNSLILATSGSSTTYRRRVARPPVFIFTNLDTSPVYSQEYAPHATLANTH